MSTKSAADNLGTLRIRIAELEDKLASADRASEAQGAIETSLRETLAYAESIVDTVREPLVVLDSELRVRTASRAFYETFSVSKQETEGQFIYDLGNGQWNIPALRTLLEKMLPLAKSMKDFEVEHEFPTLGIRVMLLNARILWRHGNHSELVLLAIDDITERKRLSEAMVRSNEDMQRFAYVAAHDLRAPLNGALKLCKLAARRLADRVQEDEAHLLALSVENLERLSVLMQDILTYSEMGNAPQQRTLVNLGEPLKIALLNLEHHITQNGAVVTVGDLPTVPADRTQMVMVFQNLISNALKYRRVERPQIRISSVKDGNNWRVSVADNGQGFESDYVETIFKPFRRLHGKNVPGSGIGLATCKRVIERLGGTIWAESQVGEGSRFHFTLPAEPING
ncbi:MAG TPA: ATP-binding protein [Bryobacteraceae bacterium]|nr:ATP-binding protein [Bryobacteraceae bacterium]